MTYAAIELVCLVCEPHERFDDTASFWKHLLERGHVGFDLARWPDGEVARFDPIGDEVR